MENEFEWKSDFFSSAKEKDIDSKFINIISDIAWKYGFKVRSGSGIGKVRIPGETYVYIDIENKHVDFSEVPEELSEEVAIDVSNAMESFGEEI